MSDKLGFTKLTRDRKTLKAHTSIIQAVGATLYSTADSKFAVTLDFMFNFDTVMLIFS